MPSRLTQPATPDRHGDPAARERALRQRFTLREETFEHRGHAIHLLMPRAADELLDEAAFEHDERMPYWAELWPSAKALARYLLENPPSPATRVIELGAGLALPSIILRRLRLDPLATDHNEDALSFIALNAACNGVPGLRAAPFDWRAPAPESAPFDLILAADVLYEARHIDMLASCLPRLIAPGGTFLLADPGRRHLPAFRTRLMNDGWAALDLPAREETQTHARRTPTTSRIQVLAFTPSPCAG